MSKQLNLVPAIKAIEEEIRKLEKEFETKVKPYKESLAALEAINTACKYCCGKGRVLRARACAEDDRPDPHNPDDYVNCTACNGTGRKVEQVQWNIH